MINTIQGIVEAAKGGQSGVIAVAAAHDEPVIEAVVAARREGIGGRTGRRRADDRLRPDVKGDPP